MSLLRGRDVGVRELFWAHPEWWVIAIGALAWVPLAWHWIEDKGHAHGADLNVATELVYWHLMVLGMMVPAMRIKARAVALRSFAERRHRAIGLFLIGYLAPWSALGIVATGARALAATHADWITVGTFAGATLWACLPIRERAMVMSYGYAPVIPPDGWEADRECLKSGVIVGAWCVVSCWVLMLGCALSGHQLIAMVSGSSIALTESVSFRPPRTYVLAMSTLLTLAFALAAWSRSILFPWTH